MLDRNVQYPNRYRDKLTGRVIDLERMPGEVTEEGSYYNKTNVLPDSVCDLLGLDRDGAQPKDAFVALHARITRGMILMWSGAISDIPAGWALCDGKNGTPDLTNMFVRGAGGSYSPGATGGSSYGHASHSHTYSGNVQASDDTSVSGGNGVYRAAGREHQHSYSGSTSSASVSIATIPPFYALAYIMRIM